MDASRNQIKIEKKTSLSLQKRIKNIKNLTEFLQKKLTEETSKLLNFCLGGSICLRASDIHFEPEKKEVCLRLRIDGIMQNILRFDKKTYNRLISRIKVVSKLKLNIRDKAQDGRFTIIFENRPIEVRVSTLPSEYGESIVLRLLDPNSLVEIKDLGIRKKMLEVFNKQITQPNGMIIVTGPTGSGKTTTLYAILKKLNSPKIQIITIEDPIEYHLPGISQTQVNPKKGYTFASGLKAIVRQDPDVILVGEIRDLETAKIAVQASLTGHLVLTTLHTNNAAGTIARFQALGEKPANIAPALNMAIAQRLARRVCKKCAQYSPLSAAEVEMFKKELKGLPEKNSFPSFNKIKIARPKGCPECNFSGYKGRVGIFEFFLNDQEMQEFIMTGPPISALEKKAVEKGMIKMRIDGFLKVLEGITTIEEINRITKH